MDIKDKLWKGIVAHYGTVVCEMYLNLPRLAKDIETGRISDPDLEPRLIEEIRQSIIEGRQINKKDDLLISQLTDGTSILSYLCRYLNLQGILTKGALERKPSQLVGNYLSDVNLPINLRRGLTVTRSDVDAIINLYSRPDYWRAIPFDEDTEPFYDAANIFISEVGRPFSAIERELKQRGFILDNSKKIREKLLSMANFAKSIDNISKKIDSVIGGYTGRGKKTWNLKEINESFVV